VLDSLSDFCHYGRTMTEKEEAGRFMGHDMDGENWRLAKAGEYILIPHYYYIDDEGNRIYDTELMQEEFGKELEAFIQTTREEE